jgi:diguanylate cyclase (GGDEF)-like protein
MLPRRLWEGAEAIVERIDGWPRWLRLVLGVVLIAGLEAGEHLAPWPLPLAPFAGLVLAFVVWFHTIPAALALALLSAAFRAMMIARVPLSELGGAQVGLHLLFLLLVVLMVGLFKSTLDFARTDYLTGIANNRAFYDLAMGEIHRARRYHRPFTVACIGLDDLGRINARFGHYVGDALLRSTAHTLKRNVRITDLVVRLGGGDFAILFPETDAQSAESILSKLTVLLKETVHKAHWPVTYRIRATTFMVAPEDVQSLINRVEDLLAALKQDRDQTIQHRVVGSTIGPL